MDLTASSSRAELADDEFDGEPPSLNTEVWILAHWIAPRCSGVEKRGWSGLSGSFSRFCKGGDKGNGQSVVWHHSGQTPESLTKDNRNKAIG